MDQRGGQHRAAGNFWPSETFEKALSDLDRKTVLQVRIQLAKIAEFLARQGSFDQYFGPLSFYFQNFGQLVKNGRFSLRPTEINLLLIKNLKYNLFSLSNSTGRCRISQIS